MSGGLSTNEIFSLLSIPTKEITDAVDEKIAESLQCLQTKLQLDKPFTTPTVVYDLKGTTAGQANSENIIRLNLDALKDSDFREFMLRETVPHEVAHIVEFQLYGVASHGHRWAHLMYLLGLHANRTHDLPLKKARKTQKFRYKCNCSIHMIGLNRHRKMQTNPRYKLTCRLCGGLLKWEA